MAIQRKTLGRGLGAIISAGAKKVAESGAKKVVAQAQTSTVKDVKIASHGTYSEVAIEKIIPSYATQKEAEKSLAIEKGR